MADKTVEKNTAQNVNSDINSDINSDVNKNIDRVVSSIIEAENCAKSMVEEAERKASDLLLETDSLIEANNRSAALSNKSYAAAQLQEAKRQADQEAERYFESKRKEIEDEVKQYRGNLGAAIKLITEKVQ